jgi:hypothetical protein
MAWPNKLDRELTDSSIEADRRVFRSALHRVLEDEKPSHLETLPVRTDPEE